MLLVNALPDERTRPSGVFDIHKREVSPANIGAEPDTFTLKQGVPCVLG